tara:strand:+ start:66 stop:356 length:291 start_codon:yes stop_codon:yes gene_type:complete
VEIFERHQSYVEKRPSIVLRLEELRKRETQRKEREVEAANKAGMSVSRFRAQMEEKRAARDAGVKNCLSRAAARLAGGMCSDESTTSCCLLRVYEN